MHDIFTSTRLCHFTGIFVSNSYLKSENFHSPSDAAAKYHVSCHVALGQGIDSKDLGWKEII